jgi:hypothetical protein
MNDIIQLVLNSKVRDIPSGMYIRFEYDKYIVRIDFDEKSEITVYEDNWDSEVTIGNPDLDAVVIDIVEDAKRLIDKYQAKPKRTKEGSGEA